MKKAKKGGKTEEERLLMLQQRAQAEEEMAKKKEEILTLFLKDKLQKEEKNTAVNLLKINESWRSTLRQSVAAEQRRELAVLSQTFQRRLDAVDDIIKSLECDLQEAELQSAQVRRVHLQLVECLVAHQDKQLQFVQRQWEDALRHLSSSLTSTRERESRLSQQQREKLEHMTTTVQQQHQTELEEIPKLFGGNVAERDKKTHAVPQDNKDTPEQEMSARLCGAETEELGPTGQLATGMDAEVKKKLQKEVVHPKAKLDSSRTENESAVRDLTAAILQVTRRTRELQDQLTRTRAAARDQLTELAAQSDATANKLQAVFAKGQKVSRVHDTCQKMEKLVGARRDRDGPETDKSAQETSALQQLMRSVNAAALWRDALRMQKDALSRENRQLRLLLRHRLDALTVSDHDLQSPDALLRVHGAPTTMGAPLTDRRHTVIEAVYAVQHSL